MINTTTYEEKIQELKQTYNFNRTDFYKSDHFGPYMAVSVGLTTFLPELEKSKHQQLTQEMFYHRDLSYIDQFYPKKLRDSLTVIDDQHAVENSLEKAHVFVTYHTGSYRLFIHHLLAKNVPFCLVTQKDYIEKYGQVSQEIVQQTKEDASSNLDIISAEDPRLLFQLKNKIENGISVVFYIDGNTGVTEKENEENKNLSQIDFLNHQIYARQGIAFLAFITKAPVVTAICTRVADTNNVLRINYIDAERTNTFTNRNEYINGVTRILYEGLNEFVTKHPEQWEGWFYLDKFYNKHLFRQSIDELQQNSLSNHESITLEMDDMAELFTYDNRYFLALKNAMKVLEIDEVKYGIIHHFEAPKMIRTEETIVINGVEMAWQQIEELINLTILKIV